MDVNDYAGQLAAFRDWCEGRGIDFRTAVIAAVRDYAAKAGAPLPEPPPTPQPAQKRATKRR